MTLTEKLRAVFGLSDQERERLGDRSPRLDFDMMRAGRELLKIKHGGKGNPPKVSWRDGLPPLRERVDQGMKLNAALLDLNAELKIYPAGTYDLPKKLDDMYRRWKKAEAKASAHPGCAN